MSETPTPPPIWMPSGGRGALLFWGGLCVLLAGALVWVYGNLLSQEKADSLLRDQQEILTAETQQLRAQIDQLQARLSQEGKTAPNPVDASGPAADILPQAQTDLQLALTKAFLSQDGLTIWNEGPVIHLRIMDAALFDGSDVLFSAKGDALARKLAAVLKSAPANEEILIESFMDNPPVGAKAAALFNPLDLSLRRGGALVHLLAETIDPSRIELRTYGSTHPLVNSESAKNRRLDLTLRLR